MFPNASVTHLPKVHSDHNPLLLEIISKSNLILQKPFRLETFWCRHLDFNTLVTNTWVGTNYPQASNSFLSNVKDWKNKVFGDIFRKKKKNFGKTKWNSKFHSISSQYLPPKS